MKRTFLLDLIAAYTNFTFYKDMQVIDVEPLDWSTMKAEFK